MKIHIVFPGPLFPISGMSQVCTVNTLKSLRKQHQIVFSDIISKKESLALGKQNLKELGVEYRPVFAASYSRSRIFRAVRVLVIKSLYHMRTTTKEELSVCTRKIELQILAIANSAQIELLVLNYWHLGSLFSKLDTNTIRVLVTHYMVEEHLELMSGGKYKEHGYKAWKHKRELGHSLVKQREYFRKSDLVVVNSHKQGRLIADWDPRVPVNVTLLGQELSEYLNYRSSEPPESAVCFYGSLGSQFNRKALKRVIESIFPAIQKELPGTKLYIIGANPPLDIIGTNTNDSVIVTGFVDDTKPYLTRCKLMLLPLETGSGFRGRTVEVLALGIPIVGTCNGLQSVGFIDGEHGYLEESDERTAQRSLELLKDEDLRSRLSGNCRRYARDNFTLEATYDKLSDELSTLRPGNRVDD